LTSLSTSGGRSNTLKPLSSSPDSHSGSNRTAPLWHALSSRHNGANEHRVGFKREQEGNPYRVMGNHPHCLGCLNPRLAELACSPLLRFGSAHFRSLGGAFQASSSPNRLPAALVALSERCEDQLKTDQITDQKFGYPRFVNCENIYTETLFTTAQSEFQHA
jgi:hypothetical protein